MRGIAAGLLLTGAAACLPAAAPEPPAFTFERAIDNSGPGKVVLTLDREIYEDARKDLADLRVLDDRGTFVPYLLEQAQGEPEVVFKQPRLLNRTFARGQSVSAILDFGDPVLKAELVLSLTGDNFRRRVEVQGRNKHETEWATLTDGAYVFAVPSPSPARYEAVRLPENNFQFLKVTVHHGPDDPERIEILDAWARPQGRRRPREQPLSLPYARAEDAPARETILTVDLGARHRPFRALVLDVADETFFRGAVVEARREPPPGPAGQRLPLSWSPLFEGTLYRYEPSGQRRENLRLDACGRERVLRVRIRNRDDQPLQIGGMSVMIPVEHLVFTAGPGRRYRVVYGNPALEAPVYDVERTVGDPAIWIAQATEAALQPPVRTVSARPLPWTERYPALLWGGLLAVVLVLGSVTWRALRSAA